MRKLDLGPSRPRHDAVRRLRALRSWAGKLGDGFDWSPYEGRGYFHWKIPIPYSLVSGPSARLAVQTRCAQILIDAAETLAARRPSALDQARVLAIINLPDMFGSEVCVFFDEAYFKDFASRDSDDQTWTAIDTSLALRWDLRIPEGFREAGYRTVTRDDDPPRIDEGEVWMIGEV